MVQESNCFKNLNNLSSIDFSWLWLSSYVMESKLIVGGLFDFCKLAVTVAREKILKLPPTIFTTYNHCKRFWKDKWV